MEWTVTRNGASPAPASVGFSRVSSTLPPMYRSSKFSLSFSSFCEPHVRGSKLERVIRAISSEPNSQFIAKPKRGRPTKKNQRTEIHDKHPQSQAPEIAPSKHSISKKRGRPKKSSLILGDNAHHSTFNDKQAKNGPAFQDISDKEDSDEEDEEWPIDEDIDERWRVRASDYFKEPRIRNELAEDGSVIDWEGESYKGIIQEISSIEWENTVFHPSPLIVLVFQRYTRASANWKVLNELEKATQIFLDSNKLPPRTVKVDAKVEKDLASALRVKDIPQLLFIRGGKLLYRETEVRSADELVKMIAHLYYNAKRPPFLESESDLGGQA